MDSSHDSKQLVCNAHPPAWLMTIANPVNRVIARSPLGHFMGPVILLEFDGRRSGKHYAVPVMSYEYNGATVVFTDGRWALNFSDGASVVVRRRGQTYKGVAQLADTDDVATALRAVLAGLRSPRRVGLDIDEGHTPTDAELRSIRRLIRLNVERS
jgi:F420H(2)-dependent quinone reductase